MMLGKGQIIKSQNPDLEQCLRSSNQNCHQFITEDTETHKSRVGQTNKMNVFNLDRLQVYSFKQIMLYILNFQKIFCNIAVHFQVPGASSLLHNVLISLDFILFLQRHLLTPCFNIFILYFFSISIQCPYTAPPPSVSRRSLEFSNRACLSQQDGCACRAEAISHSVLYFCTLSFNRDDSHTAILDIFGDQINVSQQ